MVEIVLGPPGTGKTRRLLDYVEQELDRGVEPDRIGYVSFTKKAAQEAVERACTKFKKEPKDFPHFSTLHSLCYRQLGMKRGDVLEGKRLQEFADYAGVKITGRFSQDGSMVGFDMGDRIMFMENLSRIKGIPLRQIYDADDDKLPWSQVLRVSRALRVFKESEGLHDFTDMLSEFLRSGIKLRLRSLFVDEAQDLSHLQWNVVNRLSDGCERVAVAGDDDQAIYPWAGADVDHLIDMRGDVSVLGQSWRVPPVIQTVANSIIKNVPKRREKAWSAREGSRGEILRTVRFENADVSTGETLVLSRNIYVLKEQVIPELRRQGVVFEWNGRSSLNPGLLEVIYDWERLRRGEQIEVSSVRRVYEYMTVDRGVARGFKTLPGLEDEKLVTIDELQSSMGLRTVAPWHLALDRLPRDEVGYIRAARARGEKLSRKPRVVLSTIHGAKGGEADHVVVMKEMAQRTFKEMALDPPNEARVWYVGVTRAKQKLTIVNSQTAQRCPWI